MRLHFAVSLPYLAEYIYFIVVNKTGYMYIKTQAAQQGCKTLTVACLKYKTVL